MSAAKLILISTPIGNLGDISARAREALERVQFILAEDTRELFKLLNLIKISAEAKTVSSFHEHNRGAVAAVIARLQAGEEVAIVSDAGSPVLSDPAFPLVAEVLGAGLEIETLPGPTSVVAALELSGLAPMPFSFIGFLPREHEKKRVLLSRWLSLSTIVCFEAPHRIEKTLDELANDFPSLQVAICREITKKFQSVHRFVARDWPALKDQLVVKGEFVLVLALPDSEKKSSFENEKVLKLAGEVLAKSTPKAVSKLLSEILGQDAKEIYKNLTRRDE